MKSTQAELDASGQDSARRQQLQAQAESATKEVQYLQGQLSDLNGVLSNHVAGTKLQTLQDQHAKLLANNHAERQRADAIYANRAAKQRQTKETQAAAEQIQKQLEQKVQEMPIEQQQEYYNLQVEPTLCHCSCTYTGCPSASPYTTHLLPHGNGRQAICPQRFLV